MNNVEEVIHTHTHTEYYTAMGGFMDEVLSVAYYAEHPGDDPSPAEVPPLATLMLFPLHPPSPSLSSAAAAASSPLLLSCHSHLQAMLIMLLSKKERKGKKKGGKEIGMGLVI